MHCMTIKVSTPSYERLYYAKLLVEDPDKTPEKNFTASKNLFFNNLTSSKYVHFETLSGRAVMLANRAYTTVEVDCVQLEDDQLPDKYNEVKTIYSRFVKGRR